MLAYELNIPLLVIRDKEKSYGSGDTILGDYNKGGALSIIDDVITTGESKLEVIERIESQGLKVKDVIVIINRSRHAESLLKNRGYNLRYIWHIEEIVDILYRTGVIDSDKVKKVKEFLEGEEELLKRILSPLETRISGVKNPVTKLLLKKILEKKSNLVVSIDTLYSSSLIDMIHKVGSHAVAIKTHIDMLRDFKPSLTDRLKELKDRYNFLLIEDRKFSDIGNTVRAQFRGGIYNIYRWADIVTVHLISGEGILKGLFEDLDREVSALVLARMSSQGSLYDDTLTRTIIEKAKQYPEWVSGFIVFGKSASELRWLRRITGDNFIMAMPGIGIQKGQDEIDQQYVSFEEAIKGGVDCLIIGRAITKGINPEVIAQKIKERAWEIYSSLYTEQGGKA